MAYPGGRRTHLVSRGRTAVLSSLAAFVSLQMLTTLVTNHWQPQYRDLEYGRRLQFVRKKVRKEPDRPLVIVLGSSRVGAAVRPGVLTASNVHVERMSRQDLRLLRPYWPHPRTLTWNWLKARLAPWYSNRFPMMGEVAPGWLPRWFPCQNNEWYAFDHFGWVHLKDVVDPVEYRAGVDGIKTRMTPYLTGFHAGGNGDRALRKLIEVCQRQQIKLVLLNLPEGSEFQHCYPPSVRAEWDGYFQQLSQQTSVPYVDAKSWIPDQEFLDGIHLMPHGASQFTQLLLEQVIAPALGNRSAYSYAELSNGLP
jgi:hypothetical protein